MDYLDVIGIGAVNYDYIFYCKKSEYRNRSMPEFGQEYLALTDREVLEDEIDTLLYSAHYDIQLGGSSFLAIKTINSICPELKISYVGVCGNPTTRELKAGFSGSVDDNFSFLSSKDWLFYDNSCPGIALVRLCHGTRNWIDISTGANNRLQELIDEKKKVNGENAFVEFLSRSKWIHLSSLANFSHFLYIVNEVEKAKEINPWLKISFDPGYEYTKLHRLQLKKIFGMSDYIFLNENEIDNLVGNSSLSKENKYKALSTLFSTQMNHTNFIVIKSKKCHQVVNFINGVPYSRTFWHNVFRPYQIHNDTGAGDAFAGGIIAGLLSNDLLAHQRSAIQLGAIVAAARMRAKSDPFKHIQIVAEKYSKKFQKNRQINLHQRIRQQIDDKMPFIVGIIIAIITGLLSSFLWEYIFR